jgi:sugar diacid utilization regulator
LATDPQIYGTIPPPLTETVRDTHIAQATKRLRARLDEVTRLMVERMIADVPVYRRLPPDGIADVEALATRNTRVMSAALMAGTHLDRDELRYVAEHVRERVRRGVSLEEMLHAYRVAINTFWEEAIAEGVALGFSREAALELARRTSELGDDLTTHAAETYVREVSRLRALSEQEARDLLELLLQGEVDAEALATHHAAPGLDSAETLVVVIGRVARTERSESDALETAAAEITGALTTGHASPLVAVRNGAVVAVAPAESGAPIGSRLTEAHGRLRERDIELFCGLSTPRAGLARVPAAFDQAALAVSRASTSQPIVSLAELPVVQNLMLGATGTMRSLLTSMAEDIDLEGRESAAGMRTTLRAYADASMNLTRAAESLHVHPNTLRYRLRRIEERSGRDPHRFGDLVDLICLLDLLEEARTDPG